jgi:hypothetical protein
MNVNMQPMLDAPLSPSVSINECQYKIFAIFHSIPAENTK